MSDMPTSRFGNGNLWIAEGLAKAAPQTAQHELMLPQLRQNDFTNDLRHLLANAPLNAQMWRECFQAGRKAYEGGPVGNLSLDQSIEARWFGQFVSAFAQGRVLDVGCGPQAKPAYLKSIPNERIAGIDPLTPFNDHPFLFRKALAEFIPAEDESFETLVIGTTLDHFYLLDQACAEIYRVLTPGGRLVVWTSLTGDGSSYDPYNTLTEKIDEFHLFQLNYAQVRSLFRDFLLLEEYTEDGRFGYFAFEKYED